MKKIIFSILLVCSIVTIGLSVTDSADLNKIDKTTEQVTKDIPEIVWYIIEAVVGIFSAWLVRRKEKNNLIKSGKLFPLILLFLIPSFMFAQIPVITTTTLPTGYCQHKYVANVHSTGNDVIFAFSSFGSGLNGSPNGNITGIINRYTDTTLIVGVVVYNSYGSDTATISLYIKNDTLTRMEMVNAWSKSYPPPRDLVYDTYNNSLGIIGSGGGGSPGWSLGSSGGLEQTSGSTLRFSPTYRGLGSKILTVNNNGVVGTTDFVTSFTPNIDTALSNVSFGIDNQNLSEGLFNTALGVSSLRDNTTGTSNTALGFEALYSNNIGNTNTAIGQGSMYSNIFGTENTSVGAVSLNGNTTGHNNVAIGAFSMAGNSTGSSNIAIGHSCMSSASLGAENTVVGNFAMISNSNGSRNTAIGQGANYTNIAGSDGVAIGYMAMRFANSLGSSFINTNTVIGYEAYKGSNISANNTGNANTCIGYKTLHVNTSGGNNVSLGGSTLIANKTGANNTAIGTTALFSTVSGSGNIALGSGAGFWGQLSNQFIIANSATTDSATSYRKNFLRGTMGVDSSTSKLRLNGRLQISDGTQALNRVLTCDANGVGTWQTVPSNKYTYVAHYNQTGLLDPTVVLQENDIPTALTVTRVGAGVYNIASSTPILLANKTNVEVTNIGRDFGTGFTPYFSMVLIDPSTIQIKTYVNNAVSADGLMTNTGIKITLYK